MTLLSKIGSQLILEIIPPLSGGALNQPGCALITIFCLKGVSLFGGALIQRGAVI